MSSTSEHTLLSRDEFRAAVFARDRGRCVACGDEARDAHHLMERRLFRDGGYVLANGVSLCAPCHLQAERTLLSVGELRQAAGITVVVLPEHLSPDSAYDKWGNTIHPSGQRSPGELFLDESVQKALMAGGVIDLYDHRFKYPRTPHLPGSPGAHSEDIVLDTEDVFGGDEVVASLKLDGEATTMYTHGLHARSLDSAPHPSQTWVRALHGRIAGDIPPGWRVCGENVYARHSIAYRDLPSFFFVYSVWNERNEALPWDNTLSWCALLGLEPVPVFYRGPMDMAAITAALPSPTWSDEHEGWVVRRAAGFPYREFQRSVAKWVRAGHVQTGAVHWRSAPVIPNTLRTPGS